MFGYKVNIGGMLIEVGPGVYAVTGGTTYVMDADFTYEGTMFFFNYIDKNYGHWMVRYTYTFLPASGIDGTLMMYARAKVWLGPPPRAEFSVNGHGTGDLKGVVVKAGAGPPILDPDYGLKVATHEGIIMGWD